MSKHSDILKAKSTLETHRIAMENMESSNRKTIQRIENLLSYDDTNKHLENLEAKYIKALNIIEMISPSLDSFSPQALDDLRIKARDLLRSEGRLDGEKDRGHSARENPSESSSNTHTQSHTVTLEVKASCLAEARLWVRGLIDKDSRHKAEIIGPDIDSPTVSSEPYFDKDFKERWRKAGEKALAFPLRNPPIKENRITRLSTRQLEEEIARRNKEKESTPTPRTAIEIVEKAFRSTNLISEFSFNAFCYNLKLKIINDLQNNSREKLLENCIEELLNCIYESKGIYTIPTELFPSIKIPVENAHKLISFPSIFPDKPSLDDSLGQGRN